MHGGLKMSIESLVRAIIAVSNGQITEDKARMLANRYLDELAREIVKDDVLRTTEWDDRERAGYTR